MTAARTAKKVKKWQAVNDFPLNGTEYKKGDEFKIPQGWQVNQQYTELLAVKNPNRTAFSYEVQEGNEIKKDASGIGRLTPVMTTKTMVLPVLLQDA